MVIPQTRQLDKEIDQRPFDLRKKEEEDQPCDADTYRSWNFQPVPV